MAVCVCALSAPVAGARLCELVLDCPANWAGDTLEVPDSIVMLSKSFEHCSPYFIEEGSNIDQSDTVSIMFVIDHSASMSFMDSTGVRYKVVENLIDSLAFYNPVSEVGIVVFSNQLLFDYHDDSFFVPLDTSNGWHDSYVPLTRLNTTVGSMSAVEKLKWAIAVSTTPNDTDAGGNQRLLNAQYGPTGRIDGHAQLEAMGLTVDARYNGATDISLGFEAARRAFRSAANPAHRRYVIFLSDGIAQEVDKERRPYINDYIQGDSIPTTFTVFWINRSGQQTVPDEIQAMTDSIKTNGYSTRNTYTSYWTTYGSEVDLFSQLMNIVKGTGLRVTTTYPTAFKMNGISAKSVDSTMVYFDKGFGLNADYTTFTYDITYHFGQPFNRDTTTQFDVTIRRVAGATLYTGMKTNCWDQGALAIYYQGSPVTLVEPEWTSLEVRFTPSSDQDIDTVSFTITNAAGTDILTPAGVDQGTFFNAVFPHARGSVIVDDILQTSGGDSIIVVFRNPDVPLDTLRITVPVGVPRNLAIQKAYYLDQKNGIANGYPDVLRLVVADTLSTEELNLLKSYISISSIADRGFTVSSVISTAVGIDIILTEPGASAVAPFTGLYENERLYIDSIPSLPQGGSFPRVDIAISDSMAPVIVSARFYDLASVKDTLQVVFSEAVMWIGDATPFKLNRGSDIAEYDVVVVPVTRDSATAIFSVNPGANSVLPALGDSIWIDSLSNVSDQGGVRQDGANVRRRLSYLLQYKLLSVAYFDTSGDGLVDIVRIKTDRPPDQSMASVLAGTVANWLPSDRAFTVKGVAATSEGFDVYVAQPPGTTPSTSVTAKDELTMNSAVTSSNSGYIEVTSLGIRDSLAPVIIRATFMPGIVREEGQMAPDTLKVVFSEEVSVPPGSRPFLFYDSLGTPYTMDLTSLQTGSNETHLYVVQSSSKAFPDDRDSIQIDAGLGVVDDAGNVQSNSANRTVRMGLRAYRYFFKVDAVPNPCDHPESQQVDPSVSAFTHVNQGMAIVAEPFADMAPHVSANATLRIYDAVGNLLRRFEKGSVDAATNRIMFVWDGTNSKNGRFVGTGTYLGIIQIEDNQGFGEDKRVWIGVSRN